MKIYCRLTPSFLICLEEFKTSILINTSFKYLPMIIQFHKCSKL